MGTKNNPNPNDCYIKANPDEPMFTLLGRDPTAKATIHAWCSLRIKTGLNKPHDAKIKEAYTLAAQMENYYLANYSIQTNNQVR